MELEQELLESFLSDAGDWGEKFVGMALALTSGKPAQGEIGEIFRGVHSIKGVAAFMAPDEPRLCRLCDFCHAFETYLDSLRKGETKLNVETRELVAKALFAMNDDIVTLQNGGETEMHEDLLESFVAEHDRLMEVEKLEGIILIKVRGNVIYPKDTEMFDKVVRKTVHGCSRETRIVFDLGGKARLSSQAVGTVIGLLSSVESICVARPTSFMKLVFKRFLFQDFGIRICEKREECL